GRTPSQAGAMKQRTDSPGGAALARLESVHPGTTASIWVHVGATGDRSKADAAIRSWPAPSVAMIRGTSYETIQRPALMKRRPPSLVARKAQGGTEAPPPPPLPKDGPTNADAGGPSDWDAVLYLGAREELTRVPMLGRNEVDTAWTAELRRRRRLLDMPEDDLFPPSAAGADFPPAPARYAGGR